MKELEPSTELRHLVTKADLKSLEIRLGRLTLLVGGLIVGILRFWQ